jgi:hypothetical protein
MKRYVHVPATEKGGQSRRWSEDDGRGDGTGTRNGQRPRPDRIGEGGRKEGGRTKKIDE